MENKLYEDEFGEIESINGISNEDEFGEVELLEESSTPAPQGATDVDSFVDMHKKVNETPIGFDYNGKRANVGDYVAVQGRDGKTSLKKVNDPVDGVAVLEDTDDEIEEGKTYPTLTADEWDEGRKNRKIRRNVSPAEYRRLQHEAETGSMVFAEKGGKASSLLADTMPFLGRMMVDEERGKIARMEKFVNGEPELKHTKHSGQVFSSTWGTYSPQVRMSEEEAWETEAKALGVDASSARRGKDEDFEAHKKRLRGLVLEKMQETVSRQDKAKQELEYIESDWKDMVFGSGRQSIGYGLEYAATAPIGGAMVKGGSALLNASPKVVKAVNALTKAAPKTTKILTGTAKVVTEAQPMALIEAQSNYEKFRENSYTMKNGTLEIESIADDPETALIKAIKNGEATAITEVGLGEAMAPVYRAIGKAIGKNAVGKTVVKVAKEYGKIRDATKFGDIAFEELPEENIQFFFSDVLGWGKKDSEYNGFLNELNAAFSDGGQYTLEGQWNTALGMLLQMGGQAALAGSATAAKVSANSRELANLLEGAGMSKEQVAKLSYDQRVAFAKLHNNFADNRDKLEHALKLFGGYLGQHANEIARQTTFGLQNDIAKYGEKPHQFEIQSEVGSDGKPKPVFKESLHIDGITGKQSVRKEMFDPKAGVSITENEDGTYEIYDEIHPERSFATDNFDEALRCANLYSLSNQKLNLDNRRKEKYVNNLLATKYQNTNFEGYDTIGNLYHAAVNAINDTGSFHGYQLNQIFKTDSKGEVLFPPQTIVGGVKGLMGKDGTIVAVLDNIKTAKDMNAMFSYETKHLKATKDMLMRISPKSECWKYVEMVRKAYAERGIEASELEIRNDGFAYWAQQRGHNPSLMQRVSHSFTTKNGKLNDADLEVIASRMEREGEIAEDTGDTTADFIGSFDTMSDSQAIKSEETQEEVVNETRTDEAPAQPEQAQPVMPPAGEAARPVEEGKAPSEVGGEIAGKAYVPSTERDSKIIQGTDRTVGEAKKLLREDVDAKIADAINELGVDINVKGIELHGSRVRGDAKDDSDLDLVVEYSGDVKEDILFEILNENPVYFNGIKVDINPINAEKSGSLKEYMARSEQYDAEKPAKDPTSASTETKVNTSPTTTESAEGSSDANGDTVNISPNIDDDLPPSDDSESELLPSFENPEDADSEEGLVEEEPEVLPTTELPPDPKPTTTNRLKNAAGIDPTAVPTKKTKVDKLLAFPDSLEKYGEMTGRLLRTLDKGGVSPNSPKGKRIKAELARMDEAGWGEVYKVQMNWAESPKDTRGEQPPRTPTEFAEWKKVKESAQKSDNGSQTAPVETATTTLPKPTTSVEPPQQASMTVANNIAEPEPLPKPKLGRKTMTAAEKIEAQTKRNIIKAKEIFDYLKANNPNVTLDPYNFRYSQANIKGLSLKELRGIVDTATVDDFIEQGLTQEQAKELFNAITVAYQEQSRRGSNSSEKASNDNKVSYAHGAMLAIDKLRNHPEDLEVLANAMKRVSDAFEFSRRRQDSAVGDTELAEADEDFNFWQTKHNELQSKFNALSESDRKKVVEIRSKIESRRDSADNQNTVSLNAGENGSDIDIADPNAQTPGGEGSATTTMTRNGSVGTGGSLAGNRHIRIDSVDGDRLTATMVDAAGKKIGTKNMTRAQWEVFAKANLDDDVVIDPNNPQVGDMVRLSNQVNTESQEERDRRFAEDKNYQAWLKMQKANDAERMRENYEQESAKIAAGIGRNFIGGTKVKVVDREYIPGVDGNADERKSIGGIYTGSAADYEKPSLHYIGTGEGAQVYGWGLYASNRRGIAEYYAKKDKRDKLFGKTYGGVIGFGGYQYNEPLARTVEYYGEDPMPESVRRWLEVKGNPDLDIVLEEFEESMMDESDDPENDLANDSDYQWLKAHKNEVKVILPEVHENLYEQTFFTNRAEGDESHLLSWYSNERPRNLLKDIRDNLSPEQLDAFNRAYNKAYRSGPGGSAQAVFNGDVYRILSDILGSQKSASEFLRDKCDIDGMKYPIDSYRGPIRDGDKAGWNYVSFRDDNIRVDHKWTDGELRYLRDPKTQKVVGTWNRKTNELTLFRGANASTLVHELGGHAAYQFAQEQAAQGDNTLLDKMNECINYALTNPKMKPLIEDIRSRYSEASEEVMRDEIFAALMERNSPIMQGLTKTLQGKAWYNRAWQAIKDAFKAMLTKLGFNKADLRGIDKMQPEEFMSWLDRTMAEGKNLGAIAGIDLGDGGRFESRKLDEEKNLRKATTSTTATSFMDDKRSRVEDLEETYVDSTAPIKSVQKEIDNYDRANGGAGVEEVVNADGSTDWRNSTNFIEAKDKENGHLERNIRELNTRYIDPAMEALAKAIRPNQDKADLINDFNLYLQCKHAAARNRKIANDRGDTYTPDYSEGMGMITLPDGLRVGLSENVANQLLAKMERKYGAKFDNFDDAAQSVYKMLEADLYNRYQAGLLSAEEWIKYMERRQGIMDWGTYIPLKDDLRNTEAEAYRAALFSPTLKRNEFMKAKGRGNNDIADSPFAAAVLQAEQGIIRSSRNVLANVEANLAAKMNGGFVKNGMTDFSVTKLTSQGQPAYAEVVSGVDTRRKGTDYEFTFADGDRAVASAGASVVANRPDIHLFKRDGKLYAIRYPVGANGRGIAVAKAFSNENMGNWGGRLSLVHKVTHWLSAMRTQYSPEFMVINPINDNIEAAMALVGRYGLWDGGKAFWKTIKYQWRNRKDLWHYVKTGEARGFVKNAIDAGILTKGGIASEGIDAETNKLSTDLAKLIRKQKRLREMSVTDMGKSLVSTIVDFISMANSFAEYSTRIGIASALEEYGVPRKDAIKFARDATVNFNRKGTAMPYINGLFMFSNASVQGTMRFMQAIQDDFSNAKKPPKGQLGHNKHKGELVGLLVAIGVAQAIIDIAFGNDDEREKEGGRNARNRSEYDRKHNFTVPIGGGLQSNLLRLRGPYAIIPYLAQTITRYVMDEIDAEDAGAIIVNELGAQMTDLIGGNGVTNDRGEFDTSLFMQSIAPTLIDPLVQIATGEDYKGDDRLRKKLDKNQPDSWNGKRNTPGIYKGIAKGLNYITGGNENRIGKFDVAPENIQLLAEFIGGGPLSFAGNVYSSAENAAQWFSGGTPEKTLSQIPFVRRFVREYPDVTGRYYDAIEMYDRDKAEYKKTTSLEVRRELRKNKPYLSAGNTAIDNLIALVNELTHLERGEVKRGNKWVEPKVKRSEEQKEKYHKQRLKLQATILKRLGE